MIKCCLLESRRFFPLEPEHFARDTAQSMDKAHGRFESRAIESVEHRFSDWPETRQIFHIMRKREFRNHCSEEHAYGVTSLTQEEAGAEKLLKLNRNHWHIENRLHHVRDMTFGEDQSRIRHKGKVQIICAIRNSAIALAALAGSANVMEAIETFGEQREKALLILTMSRTE